MEKDGKGRRNGKKYEGKSEGMKKREIKRK